MSWGGCGGRGGDEGTQDMGMSEGIGRVAESDVLFAAMSKVVVCTLAT